MKKLAMELATTGLLLTTAALADGTRPMLTECVPLGIVGKEVKIIAACDASAWNQSHGLKVNERGCALPRQTVTIDGVTHVVFPQSSITRFADGAPRLPACGDAEAAVPAN